MPWTIDPPTEPGVHRCRFNAGIGIDQTPFDVACEPDTLNGVGLCVRDRWGLWNALAALYPVTIVEWWRE